MHISEGMLPAGYAIAYGTGASVCIAKGICNYYKESKSRPIYKQLTGVFTAAIFVISLLPIPIPMTGTCSHPAGTPLAAIFMGPAMTSFMSSIGLFIQALFFAHGGLTTLGANTLTMGVFGGATGWIMFKACRKCGLSLFVSGLLAGLIGDLMVYAGTSIQLALAIHGDASVWTLFRTVFAAFLPAQGPLSVLEGVLTGFTLKYIAKVRPDILLSFKVISRDELVNMPEGVKNEQ